MTNSSNFNLNFPQYQDVVPTFQALRNYALGRIQAGDTIQATGQTVFNDGLGGDFVWDPNSTLLDDNVGVIHPTGVIAGRWVRISGQYSPVDASNLTVTANGRTRTISSQAQDFGYDATSDILAARLLPGYIGDCAALNAALLKSHAVCFRPEVGSIVCDSTIQMTLYGQSLTALGGGQAAPIIRTTSNTQSTLVAGSPTGTPAGSLTLTNLWFIHQGRLGYTSTTGALPNLLTNNTSHVEVYGGQNIRIRDCGGYGMPHGISLFYCGGGIIENLFWYGSVYNPILPSAQEGQSVIRLASHANGHNVNIEIVSPEIYGGNTLGVQSRVIGGNTVNCIQHCGPRTGLLIQSSECLAVRGGFFAGMAESCVSIAAASTYDILQRVMFSGTWLDESNTALVITNRISSAYPLLDGLDLNGCGLNGQIMTQFGLYFLNTNSIPSVQRVKIIGSQFRATLGSSIFALGVEDMKISECEFVGYNCANVNFAGYSSGVYCGANANYVRAFNCQFGGGINLYTSTNTVDANGITPNGCQFGVVGDTGSTNCDYAFLKNRNLAKTGGQLISGTFTAATA